MQLFLAWRQRADRSVCALLSGQRRVDPGRHACGRPAVSPLTTAAAGRAGAEPGLAPHAREIAAEMGPGLVDHHEPLCTLRSTWLATLEGLACNAGDGHDLNRHMADDAANLPAMLQDRHKGEVLVEVIKNLPRRSQCVMNLDHAHGMHRKQIAAVLKMTGSRVCPLPSRRTARLRSKLRVW